MQWTGLNELREKYLSFFESKGHLRLDSFPLVPKNDPSLLLINSGMAPMKKWFLAQEEPPRHRVTTCQKCIRTPDIERVGITARHGTFFEMLGNFSFQDYFKEEVIPWAWEFLTSDEWMAIPKDKLHISVYEEDDEAYDIWTKKVGIAPDHMVRLGKEDNFWEHGSGPCGPCSEIYYDRGEKYGCGKPGCTVGCDCDRYIEIWNNVFSQFDNDGHDNYTELKQKNIDTGMGLERLAVVCQNVDSLFDVDTVMNITNKVSELTGAFYGQSQKRDVSLRVITDHIRAATFMICDGILPSNEGRGYVLRRLLRRAARHGKLLGVNEPFLYKIVDTVIHENECQYGDLREKQTYITKVIRTEEESFARTIDGGMRIFGEMLAEHQQKGETVFSGADAFKLYDTFGFPIDLTAEMAADEGLKVDEDAFRQLMQEQKERAREARKALGDLGWAGVEFGKEVPSTEFVGYNQDSCEASVVALVCDDELCGQLEEGRDGIVVLDKTPFYAEMGGQVADHGVITGQGFTFTVTDVQKNKGGKFMHYGHVARGSVTVGDTVRPAIDTQRRKAVCRAHTTTHLLDAALKRVLGDHVHQAGSLVEPDRLRFDFTHFEAITPEQLSQVEWMVNDAILEGCPVVTEVLPIEEAKKKGAVAMFGEKYGDHVRVIQFGSSVEFCGGTHVAATGNIGMVKIISESSVAAGVRRIEAYTGARVEELMNTIEDTLHDLKALFNNAPDLAGTIRKYIDENAGLKKQVEDFMKEKEAQLKERLLKNVQEVNGVKVIKFCAPLPAETVKNIAFQLRGQITENLFFVAGTEAEGKPMLTVMLSDNLVAGGLKAGNLVKEAAKLIQGGGGGQPHFATAGGKNADGLNAAIDKVLELAGL